MRRDSTIHSPKALSTQRREGTYTCRLNCRQNYLEIKWEIGKLHLHSSMVWWKTVGECFREKVPPIFKHFCIVTMSVVNVDEQCVLHTPKYPICQQKAFSETINWTSTFLLFLPSDRQTVKFRVAPKLKIKFLPKGTPQPFFNVFYSYVELINSFSCI